MTILDMAIDGANGSALERLNATFFLGVARKRWFCFREFDRNYRERIREALRTAWKSG